MIKFLVPHEICNYCTLIEAVEWVSYKSYPVSMWDYNYERFYEPSTLEKFFAEDEGEEESELDKESELFDKEQRDKGEFDQVKAKELLDKRNLERSLKEEKHQLETEDAKHELFVALRKGKLTAYGILYDKVKDGFDSSAWNNKEAWSALGDDDDNEGDEPDEFDTIKFNSLYSEDMFLNESKVQKIPASHWRFEGVSWKLGKIRSPEGRYVYVHFDFNELIEVFEESEPEYIKIVRFATSP